METAKRNAVGSRQTRFTLSDAAVWTFYVLLTAASLLALCVVLTLVWPS